MSNNNVGAGILVLGELSRIENNAARETADAKAESTAQWYRAANAERKTKEITFSAKSQIHGLRARIEAHVQTEDMLIAALKEENPSHPLADRDAVNMIFEEKRNATPFDPKIIKRTYPDGVIPEGVIPDVGGRPGVIAGEPGYPDPVRNYDAILKAFKLDEETVNDPEALRACVSKQEKHVQELKDRLAADDKKGFFTSLNKEKRKDLENHSGWSISYLNQLNTLLANANEYQDNLIKAEQKKAREDVVRAKLKGMGML